MKRRLHLPQMTLFLRQHIVLEHRIKYILLYMSDILSVGDPVYNCKRHALPLWFYGMVASCAFDCLAVRYLASPRS